MKVRFFYLILIGITIFAGILRLYRINEVPVSLYWDEAASAYNAYSIALTGKDEYGKWFPILFQSFNDNKMSGNIYLMAPLVGLFGLNEFTARATSAFLGIFAVLLSYFLVVSLFETDTWSEKLSNLYKKRRVIGLLTAFLLAISPWHIQFSRTGFEANVGLTFLLLGVYLFLKGLKKTYCYFLAMFFFAITLYFYRSLHVFLPILLVSLFFIYRQQLMSRYGFKTLFFGFIVFLFILSPLIPKMLSKEGMLRARQVSVIDNSSNEIYNSAVKQISAGNNFIAKVFYNRRWIYASIISKNYISHFSPSFLFLQGDTNGRHGPRNMGLLYLWEAPFLLIGLYLLWKLPKKPRNILIIWIVAAPIAASLSLPSPHALRSLNLLPIPQILVALGLIYTMTSIGASKRVLSTFILAMVIFLFFVRYLDLYYNHTAIATSSEWADGYKQLTQYVFAHQKDYEKVIISGHHWQPYIYFLFYSQYDPATFQKEGSKKSFDKYIFGGTSWDYQGQELSDEELQKLTEKKKALVALSVTEYNLLRMKPVVKQEIRNHNNDIMFLITEL